MQAALVVIDMLNPYQHEDADKLMRSVGEMLPNLSRLVDEARRTDTFTVYVNDNFGDWSAGRREISEHALRGAAPELIEPIVPPEGMPFVVKARHSGFYQTQLEYMLRVEGIERLIMTGQVTEQCVLYSALDAYVRHFEVVVPRDAVAHIYDDLAHAALRMMGENMRARITTAADALDVAVTS
jgi:nicotinamidase-related amidase